MIFTKNGFLSVTTTIYTQINGLNGFLSVTTTIYTQINGLNGFLSVTTTIYTQINGLPRPHRQYPRLPCGKMLQQVG